MDKMPELSAYLFTETRIQDMKEYKAEPGIKPIIDACAELNVSVLFSCEGHDGTPRFFDILVEEQDIDSWCELTERLNATNNAFYSLILKEKKLKINGLKERFGDKPVVVIRTVFKTPPADKEKIERDTKIMAQAVRKGEFIISYKPDGRLFDIKLGYSCNNNCRHCVIKPNIFMLEECFPGSIKIDTGIGMFCERDLKFEEVIKIFRSEAFREANCVCLTGGEPTIRKDFIDILRWLYYNKPEISVVIQTNGRNLSNIRLVEKIKRYTRKIQFVVAIHGPEEVHNYIVNNRKDHGNPYQETVKGILNLHDVFGANLDMRTEMVLSNYNYKYICESIEEQYLKMGVRNVGISYPHLQNFSEDYVKEVAPPMNKLFDMLKGLHNLMDKHPDLLILSEEIPYCVYAQAVDTVRVVDVSMRNDEPYVSYLEQLQTNFTDTWRTSHKKADGCSACARNSCCPGVWKENFEINKDCLIPVR